GHCFEGDIAEGLGFARKEEDVRRGIALCQLLTGVNAAKNYVGISSLERSARGAVAYHHKFHRRVELPHGMVGFNSEVDIFFWRDTSYIECNDVLARCTPGVSERSRAAPRHKKLAIDAPINNADVLQPYSPEAIAEVRARDESADRATVKPTEVAKDERLQPAGVIMLQVTVEVGVKAAEYRNREASGNAHGRPTQRAFGGDVHHVRAALRPVTS